MKESGTSYKNRTEIKTNYMNCFGYYKGDKLRVEILSLTFEPSSNVALDRLVQRVYVEYRLLGVPMETTETPVSLRKPLEGEEIHYNFTRGETLVVIVFNLTCFRDPDIDCPPQ